jgi:hypothetical protein
MGTQIDFTHIGRSKAETAEKCAAYILALRRPINPCIDEELQAKTVNFIESHQEAIQADGTQSLEDELNRLLYGLGIGYARDFERNLANSYC